MNDGFIKILELNMPSEDIIGRSLSELLIYVDDEEKIRGKIKSAKELKNYEYWFKTLNGRDKCVLYNAYLRKTFHAGEVVETLIEDITDERVSYEKMKESQERYEKLFRHSADMVIICRLDGFFIEEANPVTEVITGFLEKDLIGRALEDLFHPASRKYLKETQKDLLFKGSAKVKAELVCRNGDYKDVISTLSMVELQNNEKKVIVMLKDISSLVKETEDERRRKEELESLWHAASKREQRIKDLRLELDRAKQEIKILKERYDNKKQ